MSTTPRTSPRGHWRAALVLVAGGTALVAAACADAPASTTPATSAATQAATVTSTARPATSSPAAGATGIPTAAAASSTPARKVSANSASRTELQAAFQAAGISNPANWAREVEEYRPYPTNDPTFAKLRQNLAKYNPGPGVVDAIIATLSLE